MENLSMLWLALLISLVLIAVLASLVFLSNQNDKSLRLVIQQQQSQIQDLLNRTQSRDWETYSRLTAQSQSQSPEVDDGVVPVGMSDEAELSRSGHSTEWFDNPELQQDIRDLGLLGITPEPGI